ncbi:hypothetical protein WT57_16565 [Burkholderia pseudomultivorans]|uniref:Uncharacterized protein n=1 Tax=Burkholderia pseudomultivorans TaxID=1207504 RepID=A0A132F2K6_9BURK|nr:hypothetical protein WT57_16565 [Burkholderia pseudomultivorans]
MFYCISDCFAAHSHSVCVPDVRSPILHHSIDSAQSDGAGHLQRDIAQVQATHVDVIGEPDVEHFPESDTLHGREADRLEFDATRGKCPVSTYRRVLVVADRFAAIVTNRVRFVVLDFDALIFLGM